MTNRNGCFLWFMPFGESELLIPYPFGTRNGKLYQIKENEDSGNLELRINVIED